MVSVHVDDGIPANWAKSVDIFATSVDRESKVSYVNSSSRGLCGGLLDLEDFLEAAITETKTKTSTKLCGYALAAITRLWNLSLRNWSFIMIHKADRDENNYSVLANDKTLILWLADLFGKIKVPFFHLPVYIFLFPSGWVVNHTHLVVLSLHWLGNFLSPISFFNFFFFAVFGLDKASDKV